MTDQRVEAALAGDQGFKLPRHVAIIMDGNGRWARQRFLPRTAGHRAGVSAVRKTVEHCARAGIEVLTLFAFSSENWRRPPDEVAVLMNLFYSALQEETDKLHQNGIRLRLIGDRSAFPGKLQDRIQSSEELTAGNERLTLVIAANYGGRWDVLQGVRAIGEKIRAGTLQPEALTEEMLQSHFSLAGLPEPDLFIRTGGEKRMSNFLLWQLAYTELYFTPVLWPDFDARALDDALRDYAGRERRFGCTGEQIDARERGLGEAAG